MFNLEKRSPDDKGAEHEWRRGASEMHIAEDRESVAEQLAQLNKELEETMDAATAAFNKDASEHQRLIAEGQRLTAQIEALKERQMTLERDATKGGSTLQ